MSAFLTKDLVLNQNEDFVHAEIYMPYGVPIDVSLWSAQMMIRSLPSDIAPLLSIASPANITLSSAGVVTLSIARATVNTTLAVATALLNKSGFYDVALTSPASQLVRFMQGALTIDPAVTR